MSTKQPLSHRRTHHLLLLSRLLNLRETGASPFTLLLDTVEQSAKPLVKEFMRRANLAKCSIVFVGFESLRAPFPAGGTVATATAGPKHVFITGRGKKITELQQEIVARLKSIGGASTLNSLIPFPKYSVHLTMLRLIPPLWTAETLIIIDTLHPLCSLYPLYISIFLSSLITPATTLLATYHLDIPLTPPQAHFSGYPDTAPHPLTLLQYLCTTLITVHSINHVLKQKRHRDKSLLPPRWGLLEEHPGGHGGGIEGAIIGLGANSYKGGGIVLEMEHRRKSGRGVQEWFFLPFGGQVGGGKESQAKAALFEKVGAPPGMIEKLILLEDHPEWRLSEQVQVPDAFVGEGDEAGEMPQTTFDLRLTEKQRKARDEVVLPYFDAQEEWGGGGGGGGRILYMPEKAVDDWDDEEDEF
ncbi:Elongator complex protein 5 [Kalaharituber pfeilii]|nr:Elongator complex protein 5 [Kalaharituber pfeilii]